MQSGSILLSIDAHAPDLDSVSMLIEAMNNSDWPAASDKKSNNITSLNNIPNIY